MDIFHNNVLIDQFQIHMCKIPDRMNAKTDQTVGNGVRFFPSAW